ncbi:MAG: response regulator transcription factor [Chloroflexi bacterium]|nr:response regulator transcription factor [Chloroflexota bacterium]
MERIRVLVVDDHALFRRGVTAILADSDSLCVIGEAADGFEAIEKAKNLAPDVIVMDLHMPCLSGLQAIQALQAKMPQIKILVLTVSEMESDLIAALKFGASGYLLKKVDPDDLIFAVHHIAQGGVIISPLIATALLGEVKRSPGAQEEAGSPDTGLSQRESEVLQLVADGKSNKEIAESLYISENTVKSHMHNIMEKLHLANRSQAVAYALKMGLVRQNGR